MPIYRVPIAAPTVPKIRHNQLDMSRGELTTRKMAAKLRGTNKREDSHVYSCQIANFPINKPDTFSHNFTHHYRQMALSAMPFGAANNIQEL